MSATPPISANIFGVVKCRDLPKPQICLTLRWETPCILPLRKIRPAASLRAHPRTNRVNQLVDRCRSNEMRRRSHLVAPVQILSLGMLSPTNERGESTSVQWFYPFLLTTLGV